MLSVSTIRTGVASVGPLVPEHHEPFGLDYGQAPQKNLIDQRKYGRICANSQGQRDDSRSGKSRSAAKLA